MLATTDFTGLYKIAQDVESAEILAAYIEKYEKKYLIDLFGFELYELFIADLDVNGAPQTEKFQLVYNELEYSVNGDSVFYPLGMSTRQSCFSDNRPERVEPKHSNGIREMLKGFIFFHYVNEYGLQVSQTGLVQNKNENADIVPGPKHLGLIESRYNDAVASYRVIMNYLKANSDTYPEYHGIEHDFTHWGGI